MRHAWVLSLEKSAKHGAPGAHSTEITIRICKGSSTAPILPLIQGPATFFL